MACSNLLGTDIGSNLIGGCYGIAVDILIPSLTSRSNFLTELLYDCLKVDIVTYDRTWLCADFIRHGIKWKITALIDGGKMTVGEKRNKLIEKTKGSYVWFIDDDDLLLPNALERVASCIGIGLSRGQAINDRISPDVITFNGFMTTDGVNREDFEIKIGNDYVTEIRNGKNFYKRFPNHICPMRREIAEAVKFEHINYQEDYKWSKEINDRGLIKNSIHIEEDVYHYRYRTKK